MTTRRKTGDKEGRHATPQATHCFLCFFGLSDVFFGEEGRKVVFVLFVCVSPSAFSSPPPSKKHTQSKNKTKTTTTTITQTQQTRNNTQTDKQKQERNKQGGTNNTQEGTTTPLEGRRQHQPTGGVSSSPCAGGAPFPLSPLTSLHQRRRRDSSTNQREVFPLLPMWVVLLSPLPLGGAAFSPLLWVGAFLLFLRVVVPSSPLLGGGAFPPPER